MSNSTEILDVLNWKTGEPTGGTVTRKVAHLEGIPHKAMHLWVYSEVQGTMVLLFQQRSYEKQNFPGQFGPTVGGHVTTGEGTEALLREAEEEVGLGVGLGQIEKMGYTPCHHSLPGGYQDFEWIEDWRVFSEQPFDQYVFNDGEVIGMLAIGLPELINLPSGPQNAVFFAGEQQREVEVSAEEFVDGLFESPLFAALSNPVGLLRS